MVATVVILQSVQPLTTDPAGVWPGAVRVLTDSTTRTWRSTPSPRVDVVVEPRRGWLELLRSWARDGDLEVVSNDEFCLEECARLRALVGLPSRSPQQLVRYLDKVVMKAGLRAAGIEVPAWSDMTTAPPSGSDLPDPLHLPVVVKPRKEANSRGVRVLRDRDSWRSWLEDHQGERGWQVQELIKAPMHFVDGVVDHGRYEPVLVGSYLGPLLGAAGSRVLGAVSVPRADPLWDAAARLGDSVVQTLGSDGRFVTHLEFFSTDRGLVVLEVAARAPGAMVAEMGRAANGENLELLHLQLQAGHPAPSPTPHSVQHSAWISVLARPGERLTSPPPTRCQVDWVPMPEPPGISGPFVAAMAMLTYTDHSVVDSDAQAWRRHAWTIGDRPAG